MPSLAAGLAAERRRKNAKHARRLEKKLGVKVAGSEERRLSGVFGHSVSVLSTGPNERFSGTNAGTAYGDGTYLAEDPGKNDQYVTVDEQWDQGSELHKRLYGHNHRHPGKVYYLLVCRVVLGHHVRTQQSGRNSVSTDGGSRIFPISFRELAPVPGVTPPVHYHSLLADVVSVGARYREVVVFHSELIYPEYVLAYQRFEGARGPL